MATMKDGKPLTFCTIHAERLANVGIKLITLAQIHAIQGPTKEELEKQKLERERREQETAFINSLKE